MALALLMLPPLMTPQVAQGEQPDGYTLSVKDEYNIMRPGRVKAERVAVFYMTVRLNIEEEQRKAEAARLAAEAEAQRVAAEQRRAAAAAERQQHQSSSSSAPAMSGSCAAMAPEGFPDYIVQRESGGDPNAYNSSSGARGCAQILDSHFNSGATCDGLGYEECWNKLWAGGAGASHWACTPESGCG